MSSSKISPRDRRRSHSIRVWRDRIFVFGFILAIVIGILGLAALLFDVLVDGLPFLNWNFLNSYASRKPLESGILAPLAGTIWIVGLTALLTIPIGVGTAIYLEEFAQKNRFNRLIELNIANLAGVPSVIYGLLGLAVFVQFLFNGSRNVTAGPARFANRCHRIAGSDKGSAVELPRRGIRNGGKSLAGRKDCGPAPGAARHDERDHPRTLKGDRGVGAHLDYLVTRVGDVRTGFPRFEVHRSTASNLHMDKPAAA